MRRHETDGVSLVFGVIFCGIAGLWALVAGDVIGTPGLRVAIPVVLILAGLSGVFSTLASGRRRRAAAQSTGNPTRSST